MANRAVGVFLALAATVALSGCGTAVNLGFVDLGHVQFDHVSPDARVYGGVLEDLQFLHIATVGRNQLKWSRNEPWQDALGAALLLIDLPISAVGDTVTLPITAHAEWKRQVRAKRDRDD